MARFGRSKRCLNAKGEYYLTDEWLFNSIPSGDQGFAAILANPAALRTGQPDRAGAGGEAWIVHKEFRVSWMDGDRQIVSFYVAAGFETDLASIPQALRSFIPQVGRHLQAAVTHDWCYSDKTRLTRAQADLLFLDGMRGAGVPWLKRRAMYAAVRAFGARMSVAGS